MCVPLHLEVLWKYYQLLLVENVLWKVGKTMHFLEKKKKRKQNSTAFTARRMHINFNLGCFFTGVKWLHTLIKFSPFSESGLKHSPVLFFCVCCEMLAMLVFVLWNSVLSGWMSTQDDTPFDLSLGCGEQVCTVASVLSLIDSNSLV